MTVPHYSDCTTTAKTELKKAENRLITFYNGHTRDSEEEEDESVAVGDEDGEAAVAYYEEVMHDVSELRERFPRHAERWYGRAPTAEEVAAQETLVVEMRRQYKQMKQAEAVRVSIEKLDVGEEDQSKAWREIEDARSELAKRKKKLDEREKNLEKRERRDILSLKRCLTEMEKSRTKEQDQEEAHAEKTQKVMQFAYDYSKKNFKLDKQQRAKFRNALNRLSENLDDSGKKEAHAKKTQRLIQFACDYAETNFMIDEQQSADFEEELNNALNSFNAEDEKKQDGEEESHIETYKCLMQFAYDYAKINFALGKQQRAEFRNALNTAMEEEYWEEE